MKIHRFLAIGMVSVASLLAVWYFSHHRARGLDKKTARLEPHLATQPPDTNDACADLAQELTDDLAVVYTDEDPTSTLADIGDAVIENLSDCKASEPMWYLLARVSELGGLDFPMKFQGLILDHATMLTTYALTNFPRSVGILTVYARLSGDMQAARKAYVLDPKYGPAAVVLAKLLLEKNAAAEANRIAETIKEPERVQGAAAILARTRLAVGDATGALTASHIDENFDEVEPGTMEMREKAVAETLVIEGLALSKMGQQAGAADRLLSAAIEYDSQEAASVIEKASGPLRAALQEQIRNASEAQRHFLRQHGY